MSDDGEKTIREILIEKDEVSLVKQDGTYIGPKDKYEAHKYPTQLHLAISVWLFNLKGEVLLQQRSDNKIVGAGWWANSACGNVWPTETFFDCTNRRLNKELGLLGVGVKPSFKFTYKAYGNEKYGEFEVDQVYVGLLDKQVTPNPDEVNKIMWVDFKELYEKVSVLDYISPDDTIFITDTAELKEKTPVVNVLVSGVEVTLAPWTILMLKNPKLIDSYTELFKKS